MSGGKEDGVHSGHRKRLKDTYLKKGLDGFHEHQALELLLFYAIPRQDTNPIAHKLIDKFGSLYDVLNASHNELTKSGRSENTAAFIRMINEIGEFFDQFRFIDKSLTTTDNAMEFCFDALHEYKDRRVCIVCLNAVGKILHHEIALRGTSGEAAITPRRIAEIALANGATAIVLAHNHLSGNHLPLPDDIGNTKRVQSSLLEVGVELREHIIVSNHKCYAIMRSYEKEMIYPNYKSNGRISQLSHVQHQCADNNIFQLNERESARSKIARLRDAYIKNGLAGFNENEALELLLSYATRSDANPSAQKLIAKFGSLHGVINASYNELIKFGLSQNAATLLCLTNDIGMFSKRLRLVGKSLDSIDDVIMFCFYLLSKSKDEHVFIVCLNETNKVLHYEMISRGTPGEVPFLPRRIVEIALEHSATAIVLAHNHPSGNHLPSVSDINNTERVQSILLNMDVKLLDHIIVSFPKCYAIIRKYEKQMIYPNSELSGYDSQRQSVQNQKDSNEARETFSA
ncbi:MAG: hypothetical protein J1E60_01810 [Christensenellaceae bacterium]|nr:hypothetical protein [Christensenellaceae bacterium]